MKTANLSKPSSKSRKLSRAISPKALYLDSFEQKVLAFAHNEGLWKPKESILLAISGGPDSVCLFFTMLAIAKREGLLLSVAHINHNLRDKDALRDAFFVENLAKEHSIPFFQTTLPKSASSSEEYLRTLRYTFLEELVARHAFDYVALGHHADDQAETFLLRLLRGSGADGLKSMRPKKAIYIRPLLSVWKKDILFYLKKKKLPYMIDSTNHENHYQRNKVRNLLIPYLKKNYQPNIKSLLVQTAELLQESFSPQVTIPSVGILQSKDSTTFSLDSFLALTKAERFIFLRKILSQYLSQPISRKLALEILKVLESDKNKTQVMTFHGLKLSKKGVTVTLQKNLSD
jgi:tRNA(Ile)-lysidine synthetase-like protein